jgi:hypothetical protein
MYRVLDVNNNGALRAARSTKGWRGLMRADIGRADAGMRESKCLRLWEDSLLICGEDG